MPVKKSPATVSDGGFAGADRHARQIALDVLRELGDGTIAAFGLLAQRLDHDGVEIAAQPALQLSRLQAALDAHRLRGNGGSYITTVRYFFLLLANDGAWFLRLSFANQPLDLEKRLARTAVGPMAGQQIKEQHSQRIDIGCGRDRLPANLFWARVFRGHGTPVRASDQ